MQLRRKKGRGDANTRRRRGREKEGEKDQREDQMREIAERMNGEGEEREEEEEEEERKSIRNRAEPGSVRSPRCVCVVARERSGERGAIDGRSAETLRDRRFAPRYSGERFISAPHLTLHFAPSVRPFNAYYYYCCSNCCWTSLLVPPFFGPPYGASPAPCCAGTFRLAHEPYIAFIFYKRKSSFFFFSLLSSSIKNITFVNVSE